MKNCFLTFFLAMALLTSCMNLPVTEIEIEIPEAETHLVLHAHLVDTDSVITAHLYKSTNFFERDTLGDKLIGNLPNGNVELHDADNLISALKHLPDEERKGATIINYSDTLPHKLGDYGQTITIRATHPDYPPLTATQTFPNFVPITSAKLVRNAGTDYWDGTSTDGIEVTLNDPADESNYYQVSFLGYPGPSHSSEYSSISFLSNAPALDMQDALEDGIGREFAYLSDETFNGASFHFSAYFREQTAEYDTIYVRWRAITKEWYEFIRSSEEQFRLNGFLGNYAEPFNVISNIEGGHGIFGLGRERLFVVSE